MPIVIAICLVAFGWTAPSLAEPAESATGQAVLERYLAQGKEGPKLRNVSMPVAIEARLPMLDKHGELEGLRHISEQGKVSYEVASISGDKMVKKDVIARYIAAEVESSGSEEAQSLAINEENYDFAYKGAWAEGGWRLHLYQLTPREKRIGLFEGWLWIEVSSGMPVRASGRFVKNPSVFLKSVEFQRDYALLDGMAVPVRIESVIETRLVGRAEINIRFGEPSFHGADGPLSARKRE